MTLTHTPGPDLPQVEVQSPKELQSVAALLGFSAAALQRGLTSRTHNVRGSAGAVTQRRQHGQVSPPPPPPRGELNRPAHTRGDRPGCVIASVR